MTTVLVFIAGLLTVLQSINGQPQYTFVNFCEPKLCDRYLGSGEYQQQINIACNNPNEFAKTCPPDRTLVPLTQDLVALILSYHNDKRNSIALGEVEPYQTATRMCTMKWSKELAYTAELNVKTCKYGHDACRNTPNYPHAGQNIGETKSHPHPKTPENVIKEVFNEWFIEHKHAGMPVINNYTHQHHKGPSIGHFTQVVQDDSIAVGCAIARWTKKQGRKIEQYAYFVCNYAMGNIDDQPIYTQGFTASQCNTGTNMKYSGLCSEKEIIPPEVLAEGIMATGGTE